MHAYAVSEREREGEISMANRVLTFGSIANNVKKIYDLYDRTAANGRSHLIISAFKSVEKFFVDRLRA